jgi:transposase-like protein
MATTKRIRRTFDDGTKSEILAFAAQNGKPKAIKKYKVGYAMLASWGNNKALVKGANAQNKMKADATPELPMSGESSEPAPKKKSSGKRYTDQEKQEIVSFVARHNEENGRGGQSAAGKKFGVSALSISTWIKKFGSSSPSPKPTAAAKRSGKPSVIDLAKSAILEKMMEISGEIEELQSEFAELKSQL